MCGQRGNGKALLNQRIYGGTEGPKSSSVCQSCCQPALWSLSLRSYYTTERRQINKLKSKSTNGLLGDEHFLCAILANKLCNNSNVKYCSITFHNSKIRDSQKTFSKSFRFRLFIMRILYHLHQPFAKLLFPAFPQAVLLAFGTSGCQSGGPAETGILIVVAWS